MRIQLTISTSTAEIEGGGREIDVEVRAAAGSCLADLAPMLRSAVGAEPDATISIDGRPLPPSSVIGTGGLVSGARLSIGRAGHREEVMTSALQLRVVGGPDAGRVLALPRGSTTIGRCEEANLVVRDTDISRLHVEVRVEYDSIWVRDLGSTNGTTLAGERIGRSEAVMPIGEFLNIGSSTLAVIGTAEPPATTRCSSNGLVSVQRSRRIQYGVPENIVEFPPAGSDPPRPRMALIAVLLPTVLSVGLALAMRNPQLLAFALLTPITVVSAAVSDRWTWRRSSRAEKVKVKAAEVAAQSRLRAAIADEVEYRRRQFADPATIAQAVSSRNCRLWERRRADADFLEVRLGLADQPAHCRGHRAGVEVAAPVQSALPATIRLATGPLGLAGPLPLVRGSALDRLPVARASFASGRRCTSARRPD